MLRGIIFDKDGTLFSFSETWGAWCERLVTSLAGNDPTLQQTLAVAIGYDTKSKAFKAGSAVVSASADETTAILADLLPAMSVAQVEKVGLDVLNDLPLSPVTELRTLFSTLKRAGYKLGLATNDYEYAASEHLTRCDVIDQLDFICGFDSGFGSKPEPGMIEAFCSTTGLSAREVIMVGDSTHDLLAGKAAGVGLNIGVLTGPASREELTHYADVVLNDISELPAQIERRLQVQE